MKIVAILISGFIVATNLVLIFYTIANTGKAHSSGDLAGSVLSMIAGPILTLPVAFVLYLTTSLYSKKKASIIAGVVALVSFLILALLDFALRRSF